MWTLRMVAFLAVVIAAEPSLYGHHIHQAPAVSFYNPHHTNTAPSNFYHHNSPQEINVQQPQISIQPQISLQQQIDPSVNITAGHPGAYWPQHIAHHPGFGWPNGGISYRTEPPNPNEVHPSSLVFGTQGWGGPVFIQPLTTPTPKPASRNNENVENNRPKTKANNFKTPNRNKLPKKKSQPLQNQKSRSGNKQRRKQKKTGQRQQQENEAPFNFSYIPDEFLNKGFPIYPRLELVRDAFGIPTVVPVFRLNETAVREQQKRQQQRQQNQQQQNQGQQQNINNNNNNQQQPLFFQNGIPVFNQGQGPVLTNINGVPVSPFVNQLNNFNNVAPFSNGGTFTNIPQQQFQNQLSNPTGFISRDTTQTQQAGNGTGDPNSPFYGGWPSGGPFQPQFQGIPQHGVPYPYFGASGGGWSPQVYVNTTVIGGNAGAQPGQLARRETNGGNNNNNNNNNNNTDTTPSKTASGDNSDYEEENENESEAEGEDPEEKSKEEVEDEEEEGKKVEEPVQEDVEEATEEEIEENEMTKQMRLNNGNQNNTLNKEAEIQILDPMGDELDEENEVDYNKSQAGEGDEENYVDTVEVKDEIPKEVLKQMIEEYNEKNKDTPITKDEENTEQVIDKLREQVAKLLKVFGEGNTNTGSQSYKARDLIATGIEWNKRLRDRYQLKTPIFFERATTK